MVNILNVGHNKANIELTLANGKSVDITDMMTSNPLETRFEIASEQVLLLEVTPK
ncbi:hypothetical protein [Psychrosphaera algicola]|uniref:Uncharacterized protein n=1 Tax=Psychrosphaera algicola TaxID=3023714 RepID=A0ABT5FA86_9GAMM|nr:hypothetical protein [Psychrosphaera sp. G1-22]MDC2887542.1 hypothetical protein [Psychrosphaera sp. G1-22]